MLCEAEARGGRVGFVRTNIEADAAISIPGFSASESDDEDVDGLRVGGGVEGKFGNVSVRGEYTYTNYEDPDIAGLDIDLDQHLVRVGVAYYF